MMMLIPVRAFFKWLARNYHLLYNPASEIELLRAEKQLPKHVLTAGEAEAVLAQADPSTPLKIRDRAILETLYSTGIRRLELANLQIYDPGSSLGQALDFERGTLMIRQGKGKKDRLIPRKAQGSTPEDTDSPEKSPQCAEPFSPLAAEAAEEDGEPEE